MGDQDQRYSLEKYKMKLLKIQIMKLFKKNKSPRLSQSKPLFVEIKDIGIIGIKRSYRAKRLILKINEDRTILVSVPRGVSSDMAIGFVVSKTLWIKKTLKKMSMQKEVRENSNEKVDIIDRQKAKPIIINRVEFLAKLFDFSYSRITIKDQKTIWGSCSSKNNLNFNYKIASLPEKLMDYVILHELVHTKVKNHSKRFWDKLDQYVPDSKSLRKELKNINFSS